MRHFCEEATLTTRFSRTGFSGGKEVRRPRKPVFTHGRTFVKDSLQARYIVELVEHLGVDGKATVEQIHGEMKKLYLHNSILLLCDVAGVGCLTPTCLHLLSANERGLQASKLSTSTTKYKLRGRQPSLFSIPLTLTPSARIRSVLRTFDLCGMLSPQWPSTDFYLDEISAPASDASQQTLNSFGVSSKKGPDPTATVLDEAIIEWIIDTQQPFDEPFPGRFLSGCCRRSVVDFCVSSSRLSPFVFALLVLLYSFRVPTTNLFLTGSLSLSLSPRLVVALVAARCRCCRCCWLRGQVGCLLSFLPFSVLAFGIRIATANLF